jgi:osmotically-inducible protein OsmY
MNRLNTWSERAIKSVRVSAIVAIAVLGAVACSARQQVVQRDDGVITNDVRARLAADAGSRPLKIDVDTKAGVVHLTGVVPTDDDRDSVERIARATAGVRSVDNDVTFGRRPEAAEALGK